MNTQISNMSSNNAGWLSTITVGSVAFIIAVFVLLGALLVPYDDNAASRLTFSTRLLVSEVFLTKSEINQYHKNYDEVISMQKQLREKEAELQLANIARETAESRLAQAIIPESNWSDAFDAHVAQPVKSGYNRVALKVKGMFAQDAK